MNEVLSQRRGTATAPDGDAHQRPGVLPRLRTLVEHHADGSILMSSADPLPAMPQRSFAEFVPQWAQQRASQPALCERDPSGQWRRITWAELWQQVQSVAAGLLGMGLGPERPLMVLSGNSMELAVLLLAAEYAGIPLAPVSPAYSQRSGDFARLKGVRDLMPPAALFIRTKSG
mgnify:CR=1 FL=1